MSSRNSNSNNKDQVKQDANRTKLLEEVSTELSKTSQTDQATAFEAAQVLTQEEVIQQFNAAALQLFTNAYNITVKRGKEREYKIGGYKTLYEKAVKANRATPIDQFTLIILKFASDIYARNANKFLKMDIPEEIEIESDNEFGLIHSKEFKKLWVTLTNLEQNTIIDNMVEMTQFAHIFFIQKIIESSQK